MLLRWRGAFSLLVMFLIIGRAVAQSACPTLVQEALDHVVTSCENVSRNQACYGNIWIHATPQTDTPAFQFDSIGDIVDVLQVASLRLDPLDENRGIWGIAMMQLQADIPETLPGQNVTFLLFGDVEIENKASADQSPMQAFYLRSGLGDAACLEAPESGVLIQTPRGIESVHFNINGVDFEVGSTIMLQAQPAGDFIIRALEGAAVVTVNGTAYPVIAGTQISLPLNDQMQVQGPPSLPIPLSNINLEALPLSPLPRPIPPPAPLPDAALIKLQMRLEAGIDPCGVPGLPACEHALAPDPDRRWAIQLPAAPSTVVGADPNASTSFMSILNVSARLTTTAPITNVIGNPSLEAQVLGPLENGGVNSVTPNLSVPTVPASLPVLGGQPDALPTQLPVQENILPAPTVVLTPTVTPPENPIGQVDPTPMISIEVDVPLVGPETDNPILDVNVPLLPPVQIDCLIFCRR